MTGPSRQRPRLGAATAPLHPSGAGHVDADLHLGACHPQTARHPQFVDDAFILRSSVSGVLKVNQALEEFSDKFRHRFKGGSKRAAVLYEAKRGWSLLTRCISWAQPFKTLQLQLDAACARCMALTAELSERFPA